MANGAAGGAVAGLGARTRRLVQLQVGVQFVEKRQEIDAKGREPFPQLDRKSVV